MFLARTGRSKNEIKAFVEIEFDYFLDDTLDSVRPTYEFDVSCQGSVPQSILAFLESTSYEDAVRNAVSLGGDTDRNDRTSTLSIGTFASPVRTTTERVSWEP